MTDQLDDLAMRLHKATGLSLDGCRQYMLIVIVKDKEALVAEFESGERSFGLAAEKKR